jgi:hypothetical protein
MAYFKGLSRKDTFALEAMKVVLAVHPDQDEEAVALRAFKVADGMVRLLDYPEPGESGSSILSEFEDSPQGVTDAVLGRDDVSLVAGLDDVDKEFLG